MNTDDPRFDRLVDGELNEEERRELLAGLDGEPGGWRRCALAFLESQCWKQTFGVFAQEGALGETQAKVMHLACSRWPSRLGTLLAMAACFFVAFWMGSLVEQARLDRPVTSAGATGEVAATAGATGRFQDVVQPPTAVQNRRGQPGATVPSANPWRMVTVSAPAGSSVSLPAVERNNVDAQWLRSLPPVMPDDVMQAFNRTGHQIEQHRELVPVPLKDGRRLVVPVDQVDIHYVGGDGAY